MKNMNVIRGRENRSISKAGNERGIALILALVMIAVLGMLGVLALGTSTTELKIAGNYRNDQISFYNSHETDAYGPNNTTITDQMTTDGGPLSTYPTGTALYQPITTGLPNALGTTSIRLQYLCISGLPPGYPGEGRAYHYLATFVGFGANNHAQYVTETEIIKVVPNAEDQTDC